MDKSLSLVVTIVVIILVVIDFCKFLYFCDFRTFFVSNSFISPKASDYFFDEYSYFRNVEFIINFH